MRHVVDTIAAQGRDNDTELLHVTKRELAGLDSFKRRMTGSGLTKNPKTGLHEAGWFDQYVEPFVPAVAGLAAGALTMNPAVGAGVGAAAGAGLKASHGKSTQDVLMGGVMGGIAGYGAGAAGADLATAGAEKIGEEASKQALAKSTEQVAQDTAGGALSQTSFPNIPSDQASTLTTNMTEGGVKPLEQANVLQNVDAAHAKEAAIQNASTYDKFSTGLKNAEGPVAGQGSNLMKAGTGTVGLYGIANQGQGTTDSTGTPVNKTLPKSEVYYTPYGERRTRLVAAEGGLMGLANGEYGDYDGADEEDNPRRYADGGIAMIRQMQPGGEWGSMTGDAYGAVQEHKPQWLQNAEPGGFIGSTVPGKMDYEDKKRAEADAEERKKREAEAAAKAQQEQETQDYWKGRYGMAGGGIAAFQAQPRAGISNVGFAKGRYLQGPGDGMSDSIPAKIDGKQEARLATGEFVVPADVVSGLGNGDSNSGAKQLHGMMDRVRMSRTGTKKQGKQINPRKAMPV